MKRLACILLIPLLLAFTRGDTQRVSIQDMQFTPASVEINAGDTVVWTNNDDRDHTVVAKDGSFQSGNLSKGSSFSHTFKKAGKFGYTCTLHPRMKGSVTVTAK